MNPGEKQVVKRFWTEQQEEFCQFNSLTAFSYFLVLLIKITSYHGKIKTNYVTTVSQSACLSWCRAPIGGP
jgi:hypothetical protein